MTLDSPGPWFDQNEFGMEIFNNNPFPVRIIFIHLYWPDPPNGWLKRIELGSDTIWDDGDDPWDAWITTFKNDNSIPPSGSKGLVFVFENVIQQWGGYTLEMEFDNGCYFSMPF